MTKNIVIADDHPLLLKGLKECLEEGGFTIKAAVTRGQSALAAIRSHQPCLAVLDISMPDLSGLEVATLVRKENINCHILILSLYDDVGYIARAKQVPVDGYLLKENATQEVVAALNKIMSGGKYFDTIIEKKFHTEVSPLLELLRGLSRSELKIIKEIALGHSVQQIAELFFLSPRTIQKHRENISRKLDINAAVQSLDQWASENATLLKNL